MNEGNTAESRRIVAGPSITDVPGELADERQLQRMHERYWWTAQHLRGDTAAEIACGTGQGLAVLQRRVRVLVGADYSLENLEIAQGTYGASVPLVRLDAARLPFAPESLDGLVLLEALYFLPSDDEFFAEASRVLRPNGRLLISVINRDTLDYNPRPIYYKHYGVRELGTLARAHGFSIELFGAVPLEFSRRERLLRPAKKVAVLLRAVPTSPRLKMLMKRFFFGNLKPIPRKIESIEPPSVTPLNATAPDTRHQILLCLATRL